MDTYKINIEGLDRELRKFPVNDKLDCVIRGGWSPAPARRDPRPPAAGSDGGRPQFTVLPATSYGLLSQMT